ncbi:MAG: dTMP kinase [Nitrospirae bacterium CG2_30_70_394]|nr:MAG: dTMP kinase [Nitrospirae bacterium CG2_30_70_394]
MEPPPSHGRLITLEGGDGAGKSTQANLLAARLERAGNQVVATREPGGTPLGQELRRLLVTPGDDPPVARAELLLYLADRAQHVARVIGPALARGAWVVCDRFTDSTLAYQGAGRGLDEAQVVGLSGFATGDLSPDLTLWLALDPAEAARRRADRGLADRLEQEGIAFQSRLATCFARLAAKEPERWRTVAAEGDVATVAARVWAAVADRFPEVAG